MGSKIYDIIIIGSGPAGLTAAIYATRGAASTLILGGEKWGGQLMLTTQVENFPGFSQGILGPKLMEEMRAQATRLGAEFKEINAESIDVTKRPFEIIANGEKYLAKSVIIATGAETVWLDVPGVKDLIGRGISSCAPCDAPFFRDKRVAVVGGGDAAMEEASVLTNYASEITIIHRRDTFRASAAMQKKVLDNPKIKVLWNTEITEAKGEGKLEKLILKNNKTGEISELLIDGLFVAIGHKPQSEIFKGKIDMDERGFIKVFDGARSSVPGIFVAGDVHDFRYKQAITAAGYGCQAAMECLDFLTKS
jgi:thioredoxin reductase (NADPH)